jgi:predicted component of type VI protein secretion system
MPIDPVLLLQLADGAVREIPLGAVPITLGRAPDCDVVLEGRLISRQHARISHGEQGYLLEDLGSHNGTTANGQPVTSPWVLRDGDQIELGGVARLVFADSDATRTRPLAPAEGIWLDAAAQDVWVDGQRLSPPLSPAQYALLQLLLERVDQVCTRADVIAAIWPGAADGVSDEAVDALIKRVRARLGEAPDGQRYLTTLRGRGLSLHSPAGLRRR